MSSGPEDPLSLMRRAADSKPGPLFIHYSCGLVLDPSQNPISYILVLPEGSYAQRFDAFAGDEAEMLGQFAQFVSRHADRFWIGWRFLRPYFGFLHIAARYASIVGGEMKLPTDVLDLKDELGLTFGSDFADHPRFESAARTNQVTMIGMLTAEEAAAAYKAGDWPRLRANTERKTAVIRTLCYKAVFGKFKPLDRQQGGPIRGDGNPVDPLAAEAASNVAHSVDFRSLRWFDDTYSFTANQAKVVRVLYDHWEDGTPDVGDETLLNAVDPAAPPARLSILFREHKAWNKLIVAGGSKGTHRLSPPKP